MPQSLVLITGAPASGKSTLAPAVAAGLQMPLVTKDIVKEAIHDGLGWRPLTTEESQHLGAAAFEVMWAIARHAPHAVLEANFRRSDERQMTQLRSLHPRPVEVFCRCDPEVAAVRYADRHRRGERHPVHVVADIPAAVMAEFQPLMLGPVVEVDTSQPVAAADVVERVKALLAPGV